MLPRRLLQLPTVLFLLAAGACHADKVAEPTTGALQITSTTSGEEPDPDGYTLTLDGSQVGQVGATGSILLTGLGAGEHRLVLGGVASNCALQGPAVRPVAVAETDTAVVAFAVLCTPGYVPTTAGIRVSVITTGTSPDDDGYRVSMYHSEGKPFIPSEGSLLLSGLEPGKQAVALEDVADNCAVQGEHPVRLDLVVGPPVDVPLSVVCRTPAPDQWITMSSGTTLDIGAVSGTSSSNVFATADGWDCEQCPREMTILRFNGTEWTPQLSALGGSSDVWAAPGGYAFSKENRGFLQSAPFLHYDGIAWNPAGTVVFDEGGGAIYALWGSSASDVFGVGGEYDASSVARPLIVHYDGTTWGRMTSPVVHGLILSDVWGTGPTDVYAVGNVGAGDGISWTGRVLHYNGQQWSTVLEEPHRGLSRVRGTGPSDVYVTGHENQPIGVEDREGRGHGAIRHFDGTTWSAIQAPTSSALGAIWASRSHLYVVSDAGYVWQFDGRDWSGLSSGGPAVRDIWGSPTGDVFAVGDHGAIYRNR